MRALVEAVVARPNICAYIAYHTFSAVILRPYGGYPDDHFPTPDLKAYQELGKRGDRDHRVRSRLRVPRLQVRPEDVHHRRERRVDVRPPGHLLVDHGVLEPDPRRGHHGLQVHRLVRRPPGRGRPDAAALERRRARRQGLRRLVPVRPSRSSAGSRSAAGTTSAPGRTRRRRSWMRRSRRTASGPSRTSSRRRTSRSGRSLRTRSAMARGVCGSSSRTPGGCRPT